MFVLITAKGVPQLTVSVFHVKQNTCQFNGGYGNGRAEIKHSN